MDAHAFKSKASNILKSVLYLSRISDSLHDELNTEKSRS